ncbi:ABC transporter substrate-binding protein [Kordiimonas sp. 5E331]|nr:ABC transporter substrate-binding protein [Kordiimonas laminariae]
MMKKLIAACVLFLFAPLNIVAAQDKAVDDPKGAIEFIERLSSETVAVWSDAKMNEMERDTAFKAIFAEATDINLLARGMLGRHYRSLTSDQRTQYMAAMRDYILAEFDSNMSEIGFKNLDVVGTKPASGKRGHLYVRTEILRDEGAAILANWRVRKKNGQFHIVNLEFEGINLMITNRDVFSSKIKRDGIDGLIAWLYRRAAEAAAEAEAASTS